MADDEFDFDLDSLMGDVVGTGNNKPKKKRRVAGGEDDGQQQFSFDFEVSDSTQKISENESNPVYKEELGEDSKVVESENKNTAASSSEKTQEKTKSDSSEEAVSNNTHRTAKKGKRLFELSSLNEIDFSDVSDDVKNTIDKEASKLNQSKGKTKRKALSEDSFNALEVELERIQEIQNQIKVNKSNNSNKTKEQEKNKKKTLDIVIRIMFFLMLVGIIYVSSLIIKRSNAVLDQKRIKISQADVVSNESNYIYLDTEMNLEGKEVKIKKLRLDSQELAIYLDENIDYGKYEFYVLDGELKRYMETTTNDRNSLSGGVELTFEGLDPGTEKFSLRIENMYNGYYLETIFMLDEPLKYPPIKAYYNNSPMDGDLYVQNTVFSSAYTKSTIMATGKQEDTVAIGEENIENGNIYLKHKGVTVPLMRGEEVYAYFDGFDKAMSVVKHAPLTTLQGVVEYGADKVYRQETINDYIDVNALARGQQVSVEVYGNAVTLEGIRNQGGVVVIPMSGRRENAIPSNPNVYYSKNGTESVKPYVTESTDNETFDKISVSLDAVLYAKDEDGNEFTVKSDPRIGDAGTDVLFRDDRLKEKGLNEVKIFVNNISTIEDGSSKKVNLEYVQDNIKNTDVDFESATKESFLTRLQYKSREIPENYITGFAEMRTTNFKRAEVYEPIETSTSAYYSVYIVGYGYIDNNYYAIVDEAWTARDKSGEIVKMKNRHNIVTEKQGKNYTIIYDKIVNEEE